ncbi:MAG: bifunctional UDP-N-acetylglucosamine diphosphorylase/glucosamine-1-phosphate N-acetyltransferase GlmU [Candidatus Goldiibacteriota bacterium HGW-Goldbacteria-1]|jgi:bifunctional UDP-N-acetylglucosamine pyrophosphorylase/glucosamine-1-phosphate N-acetyltransferase|nr:MAG: bifunctional UDP-N-acetylglucosamine diphosphorylase/glucosamine-1-phosphate N-acetyltransferase GlmU [Candidatus Goldiibacteriota bacterium HGW-Goldbacteria-1]
MKKTRNNEKFKVGKNALGKDMEIDVAFFSGKERAENAAGAAAVKNEKTMKPVNGISAVILAAGKGTRMKSDKTKVLHEVSGKPMLAHVIDACLEAQVSDITVVAGANMQQLKSFAAARYNGINIRFVLQKEQLGTADAVSSVIKAKIPLKDGVMILSGDTPLITPDTVSFLIKMFTKKSDGGIIGVSFAENPAGYGRIVRNSEDYVMRIVEDKDANDREKTIKVINGGIYIIRKDSLERNLGKIKVNKAKGEYYLTDIAALMYAEDRPLVPVDVPYRELAGVNSRAQLAEAAKIRNKKVLEKLSENGITIVDFDTVYIEEGVEIGSDTTVHPFTVIKAGVKIGTGCSIGPSAHLRQGAVIGNNCKIGNFVEVKNSTIGNNTNVAHLSYIGDSEIGSNVNIGAGTITANYDGVKKNKTVILDGAYVGSNSVFVAPVKIGKNAVIGAGSVITENVPDDSLAIARPRQETKTGWVKKRRKTK